MSDSKEPEDEIREEKLAESKPQVPVTSPVFNGGGGFGGTPPVDINQLDDSHFDMMKGMMSTAEGRQMMKNMMKSQTGMDLSDDQLQMMSSMMNKDTLKMAQSMSGKPGFGPSGPRPSSQLQARSSPGQTATSSSEQVGANDPNMANFMEDIQAGGQPSMDSLMKNKDMIKMVFTMLKTNPAMIRGVTANLGENNPVSKFIQNRSDDDLKKLAVWLERAMNAFMFCYPAIKIIRENFRTLLIFIVLYLVYRYVL